MFEEFFRMYSSFNRPFKEVSGYQIIEGDDKFVICINALGVDPCDVTVEVKEENTVSHLLSIFGETKDLFGSEYAIKLAFRTRPLEKVIKHFRAGVLYLELNFQKPKQAKVEILEK